MSVNKDGQYICGTTVEEAKVAFENFFSVLRNADFDI